MTVKRKVTIIATDNSVLLHVTTAPAGILNVYLSGGFFMCWFNFTP